MSRIVTSALLLAAIVPSASAQIPSHPKDLKYGELKFEIPKAESYKFKLKTGQTAYVMEDHSLPLANISITVRLGAFLDPPGKTGLAELASYELRDGGTTRATPAQFDEEIDQLAANLSSGARSTFGSAGLNCLSKDLERCLDLLFEMMTTPRFDQARLDVRKGQILESLKQRNDDAGDILEREWSSLLYGTQHLESREQTKADLDSITRDDLVNFHKTYWRPEGMLLAVTGDVATKGVLAALEKRFAAWKATGAAPKVAWPPSYPVSSAQPGVYQVEKDIPQGKVVIGQLGSSWDPKYSSPDNFALLLMNNILGGGGFTSRITKRVRSDEGLAYSAGSNYSVGTLFPGSFRIGFQSKNETVALAAKLCLEEVQKMRTGLVSDEELSTAKGFMIDSFPRGFESKAATADKWVQDDYLGRPHSYWESYRDNIRKLTKQDLQRVAAKYLDPDKMVMLIVGKWTEIEKGDANKRASMQEFHGGKKTQIPLKDPLTLK